MSGPAAVLQTEVVLFSIGELRPHEEVREVRVQEILMSIVRNKLVKQPLIVSQTCHTLLDGHHRYHALHRLGADTAPCILVDYDDPALVNVAAWREADDVTLDEVRRAASSGELLPPKTSRHTLNIEVPEIHIPLTALFAHPSLPQLNAGIAQRRSRHA